MTGCIALFCFLKVMVKAEQNTSVQLYTIISILGYCLLPFNILATFALILEVQSPMGWGVCAVVLIWSTYMATKFVDIMLNVSGKKSLIAFPIFLFYICFLLLAIF